MTSTVGERRRRPRDRRERILAVAAGRFRRYGYHRVGMADIAAEVGIAPSALYRHFGGKQDLLLAVLTEQISYVSAPIDESAPPVTGDELVRVLATRTMDRRGFGVLWEREAGNLPADARRSIRERLGALAAAVRDRVTTIAGEDAAVADLRAWAALAVLDSPAQHRTELDRERFEALLRAAVRQVTVVPLPEGPGPRAVDPPVARPLVPATRREALLAHATALFAERGYPAVGLNDIGAAAGIAGQSVYNHFDTKLDLLLAGLARGNETLWFGLQRALSTSEDPRRALGKLAADYTGVMLSNPPLITVLISELIHLPDQLQRDYRRVQNEYVGEWVHLLRGVRPELPEAEAQVLVHAALAVINTLGRVRRLRERPMLGAEVAALATAVLDASVPDASVPDASVPDAEVG